MVSGYRRVPEPPARMIPRICHSSVDEVSVGQFGRSERCRQVVVAKYRGDVVVHHAEGRRNGGAGFAWAADLLFDDDDAVVDKYLAHFGVGGVGRGPATQC